MSPEEVKALRKQLGCTAKQLAGALGIDAETVIAWEMGTRFPTKRAIERMAQLAERGMGSTRPAPARAPEPAAGLDALHDPRLWTIVRKLVEHPALLDRVTKLVEAYPERADEP